KDRVGVDVCGELIVFTKQVGEQPLESGASSGGSLGGQQFQGQVDELVDPGSSGVILFGRLVFGQRGITKAVEDLLDAFHCGYAIRMGGRLGLGAAGDIREPPADEELVQREGAEVIL